MNNYGCYLIGCNLVRKIFNIKIENVFVPKDFGVQFAHRLVDFINNF